MSVKYIHNSEIENGDCEVDWDKQGVGLFLYVNGNYISKMEWEDSRPTPHWVWSRDVAIEVLSEEKTEWSKGDISILFMMFDVSLEWQSGDMDIKITEWVEEYGENWTPVLVKKLTFLE